MVQNVHICPVGFYKEPILAAVGHLPFNADKYYFLFNQHPSCMETLQQVMDILTTLGQKDMVQVEIDPFDYNDVITKILKIQHDELKKDPESKFFINFTSGTNIVAGACCSVSYFIGATLYYVMNDEYVPLNGNDRVRIIKTPKIPDMEKMNNFAKVLLSEICDNPEGIELQSLSGKLDASPQKINHHLNSFEESGLISREHIGRQVKVHPTNQGKMFSEIMDS